MKIEFNSDYFGDSHLFQNFIKDTIEEIDVVEINGKKHSKKPDRYLIDVCPNLFTIRDLFQKFLKKVDKTVDDINFVNGEDLK